MVFCSQNLPAPHDRRVWREATALQAGGYQTAVVAPRGDGQRLVEEIDGVLVRRYPAPPSWNGLAGQAVEVLWSLAWIFVVLALVRWQRGRISALHAANPPDTFFLLGRLVKLQGGHFVYDQHDLCPELLDVRGGELSKRLLTRPFHLMERLSYRSADLVITPNNSYRDVAIRRGGLSPERVVTIRSGPEDVEARAPRPRRDPLTLVFAGVMGRQDALDVLVDAVAIAERAHPGRVRLDLVGSGEVEPQLRQRVHELGIDEIVTWAGWLTGEALRKRVGAASVGVSVDEENRFTRLSTMAKVPDYLGWGLPCILSDLPENRETAGPAAIYVKPGDPASVAGAIERLVEDSAALDALHEAASRRAELVAWDNSVPRLLGAYGWLLDRGELPPPEQPVEVPSPT